MAIPKVLPCTTVEKILDQLHLQVFYPKFRNRLDQWINEDIQGKISDSQYGSIHGSSTVLALLHSIHK